MIYTNDMWNSSRGSSLFDDRHHQSLFPWVRVPQMSRLRHLPSCCVLCAWLVLFSPSPPQDAPPSYQEAVLALRTSLHIYFHKQLYTLLNSRLWKSCPCPRLCSSFPSINLWCSLISGVMNISSTHIIILVQYCIPVCQVSWLCLPLLSTFSFTPRVLLSIS